MQYSDKIEKIVRQAGAYIRDAHVQREQIDRKSGARDLVTSYDVAVQQQLFSELAQWFPTAGFFGEEEGSTRPDTPDCFIIDPIDGTTNFTVNYRHSCISLAYARNGETQFSAVYDPYLDELFQAELGAGAYLNGVRLKVEDKPLSDSVYIVGASPYAPELSQTTFELLRLLYQNALDFRRSGSAALDLCYVAASRAGCYYELQLSPWDFAAGTLIGREAGAVVTRADGADIALFEKQSVLAGAPTAHEDFLQLTRDMGLQ